MQSTSSNLLTLLVATMVTGLAACAAPPQASGPQTTGQQAGASQTGDAPPAAAQPSATPVADNKVVVMFPEGGASLTAEANRQLDFAARLFRDANPVVMFTSGYTDRSGDEFDNVLLSARRAEAVKRGLVARGIPADRLLIQALGGSEPANVANPLAPENRRVVITWRLAQTHD